MDAWLSGEAGAYAVPSGSLLKIVHLGSESEFLVDRAEAQRSFAAAYDTTVMSVKDELEARERATTLYKAELATRLFFILYDEEEEASDRDAVASDLGDLLQSRPVVERVENVLFSMPFPQKIDVALVVEAAAPYPPVSALISKVAQFQASIGTVRHCFDDVDRSIFDDDCPYSQFDKAATHRGCFKAFSVAHAEGKDTNFAMLQVLRALNGIPGARNVVNNWASGFATYTRRRLPLVHEVDVDDFEHEGSSDWGAFANVRTQLRAVIEKLRDNDLEQARRFASQLIQLQMSQPDGSFYAAKSLCLMSQEAKQLELWDLQYEWAHWATQLRPTDPFGHGQEADALIDAGRLVEAAEALDKCAAWGDGLFAATGRAKILRQIGRLEEARSAYLAAYREFSPDPECVHALLGAAGAAREMGLLETSLREFNEALELYPDDTFLLAGKAATQSELGDWQGVKRTVESISMVRPDEVSGSIAGATALKLSGSLDAAVTEFTRLKRRFPYLTQPRIGLIDSLRMLEKYDAAINEISEAQGRFPRSAHFVAQMADVKRELGKPLEAFNDVLTAIKTYPKDLRLLSTLSRLNRACHRDTEALAIVDQAILDNPQVFWLRLERADLLKRLAQVDAALVAYSDLENEHPNYLPVINSKAALLTHLGRFDEAHRLLIKTSKRETQHEWRSFILLGVLLCRQGLFKDALVHLNVRPDCVPFARERRMLANAVASAELGYGRVAAAVAASVDKPGEVSNVIRFHALAASFHPKAKDAYRANEGLSGELIELKEEIARRYLIVDKPSNHTVDWIFLTEQNALLLEAA
ncbi:hypothetical protein [Mesorhizobium sp. M0006]|uniref:tetratricopeptide repeat protein n=2 Tax=unclassified Mesorhizobium TaxID=325217 RepID=UPI00333915A3